MVLAVPLELLLTAWYFRFTAVLLLDFSAPDFTESEEHHRTNLQLFLGHPPEKGSPHRSLRSRCRSQPALVSLLPLALSLLPHSLAFGELYSLCPHEFGHLP